MKKLALALLALFLLNVPALAVSTTVLKNNFKVLGTTTLTGAVTEVGAHTVGGNLTVTGTTTTNGAVTNNSTLSQVGVATFTVPLTKAQVNNVSKRYVDTVLVSPATGAAVDSTVYRAFVLPGRAGTVKAVSIVAQTPPTVGTDTIKVLKASSAGNTMLSAATFDANSLTANTVTQPALTATGADLQLTAAQGVYVEYSQGTATVDAISVNVSIEFEPDDF